jgi:small subunit ribosomal protein S17
MNTRRRMTGIVVSNKMTKTVVIEVTRTFRHPVYRKVIHSDNRFMAHDLLGCKPGDKVQVVESRPLSHSKRWVVEAIVKRVDDFAGDVDEGITDVETTGEGTVQP